MKIRLNGPRFLLPLAMIVAGAAGAAATELGTRAAQFTVNGAPTFLLGISYYGALGAAEETMRRDLDALQRHGFNWIRVWATWASFSNDVSAVDNDGEARAPFLAALQGLVAECDRRGLVVDVTLSRGRPAQGGLATLAAHRRAVETVVAALQPHRNWYLDLANERNVRDARFVRFEELKELRDLAKRLDPARLVTASDGGDIGRDDLREYLRTVQVDFVCPHRPRDASSPGQTEAKSRAYRAWMNDLGRVVPLHYQEPFRRGYGTWAPSARDFLTDLAQAQAGGAAGWCFHNGDQRDTPDHQPRRSFDLRERSLFEQLDESERQFLAALPRRGAEPQVWTVTETRRVLRSDLPGNQREVTLAAARNEWVSFQILLRAETPGRVLGLEADALRGRGGQRADAMRWRFYRQHQLRLETGTHRNTEFKPDWYPDPLIPFAHPLTGEKLTGARFQAVPFDLPAHETHGFWVDLYVPADAVAGKYRGACRINLEQGQAVEIPVTLTVWDFALPPVPALETEFGSPAARLRSYERARAKEGREAAPTNWATIETQCAELLAEHRLNAVPPGELLRPVAQADGSFRIPAEQMQALRGFVDRYHVNALQVPHPSSVVQDPEREQSRLRAWLAAFDRAARELNRTHLVFYTYLRDEPNTLEDYRYVQLWGRAVRDAKSVVKVLVVEQTWTAPGQGGADRAWGDLYGAVDIWCPLFSLHRQESAAPRQALGETVWTYTALCQGQPTPWWQIDYPLLHYRVPAWIAWRYRMRGLLYWGGLSYWARVEDPWQQAPYYAGNGAFQQGQQGILFHGEGSLVYPARAVGYDGIVPTIRLKALRDAVEDYDYLARLEGLGKAAEAEAIVQPLAESFFRWDKDPVTYEQARARLAALILSTSSNRP